MRQNEIIAPCPQTPNCVSSKGKGAQKMPALRFKGPLEHARDKVVRTALSIPRTQLVRSEADYLVFEIVSRIFGFVDEVEFAFDETTGRLDFRSRSLVGYYDLGVNRERMEMLCRKLVDQADFSLLDK